MRTTVHLLRHGEVHNPDQVLYGRLAGFRLSEQGRESAEKVAAYLAGRDVRHLVASPLQRAQETAAVVAEVVNLPVHTDERLIEAGNIFEGTAEHVFRQPRNWSKLINPFRPSWGEPYAEIAARMLDAVKAARDAALGHEAVCVSHQLPIWTLRRSVEGRRLWHDPRRRQCGLTSLTSFTFDGDEIVAVGYAEPAGPTPRKAVPGA